MRIQLHDEGTVSLVPVWAVKSSRPVLMDIMGGDVEIIACDPSSPDPQAMSDALWEEIQRRYGFTAPNPFEPGHFTGPVGEFWVAVDSEGKPVGSIGVTPLDPPAAELDVMYVAPEHRHGRRGAVASRCARVARAHRRGLQGRRQVEVGAARLHLRTQGRGTPSGHRSSTRTARTRVTHCPS